VTDYERKHGRLCEAAFRRGYDHGFFVGNSDKINKPSAEQIHDWRFSKDKRMIIPPGMSGAGKVFGG